VTTNLAKLDFWTQVNIASSRVDSKQAVRQEAASFQILSPTKTTSQKCVQRACIPAQLYEDHNNIHYTREIGKTCTSLMAYTQRSRTSMLDGKHNVTEPCNTGEYIGNVADIAIHCGPSCFKHSLKDNLKTASLAPARGSLSFITAHCNPELFHCFLHINNTAHIHEHLLPAFL
jgi:hypothetical protein